MRSQLLFSRKEPPRRDGARALDCTFGFGGRVAQSLRVRYRTFAKFKEVVSVFAYLLPVPARRRRLGSSIQTTLIKGILHLEALSVLDHTWPLQIGDQIRLSCKPHYILLRRLWLGRMQLYDCRCGYFVAEGRT